MDWKLNKKVARIFFLLQRQFADEKWHAGMSSISLRETGSWDGLCVLSPPLEANFLKLKLSAYYIFNTITGQNYSWLCKWSNRCSLIIDYRVLDICLHDCWTNICIFMCKQCALRPYCTLLDFVVFTLTDLSGDWLVVCVWHDAEAEPNPDAEGDEGAGCLPKGARWLCGDHVHRGNRYYRGGGGGGGDHSHILVLNKVCATVITPFFMASSHQFLFS